MARGGAFDRRELFRRAGATAAAVGLGSLVAGCAKGGTAPDRAGPTTAPTPNPAPSTTATTGPPDWHALASSLDGDLVRPADATYATARQLYNRRFDAISPAAIAYCQRPSDVQRCVDFARQHGIGFAARSGGHSFGGYSTGTGLVADVSRMASVTVSGDGATATVGTGTRLIDLYERLGASGVLVPGGSCPTVGIAGLTLGGGVGVLGRNYGLTCDQLTAVDLVTSDGRLLHCDARDHADLFWACQGGGGGNFGVATSFTFRTHPIPPIALFTLEWPWAAAVDVLGAWQDWVASLPPPVWSNCQLLASGDATHLRVTGVCCGAPATLAAALAPLRTAVGGAPTYDVVGPEEYSKAMLIEAGCEGSTVAECRLAPAGTLPRPSFAAKSAYMAGPMPGAGLTAVVDAVASLHSQAPGAGGGIVLDAYGGAINQVAPDATAFVHRRELAGMQLSATWQDPAAPSVVGAATSWLRHAGTAVDPYVHGAYQNYVDPSLTDWAQAYYGSNLPRLVEVKRAVDPDDFFKFPQSIPVRLSGGA